MARDEDNVVLLKATMRGNREDNLPFVTPIYHPQ